MSEAALDPVDPVGPQAGSAAPVAAAPGAGPAAPRQVEQRRQSPSSTRRPPGLTGRGVVVLVVVVTFVGGILDLAISGHRGHLFGIAFVAASALGALAVRRRDLPTTMVAPPLLYCLLIGVMSLIDQGGLSGGVATREAFYLGNAFVTGAPAIWIGTALAAGIGWYRIRNVR